MFIYIFIRYIERIPTIKWWHRLYLKLWISRFWCCSIRDIIFKITY